MKSQPCAESLGRNTRIIARECEDGSHDSRQTPTAKSQEPIASVWQPRKPRDTRGSGPLPLFGRSTSSTTDLEQVRGLPGHARLETTQLSAQIRPAGLKQAMA